MKPVDVKPSTDIGSSKEVNYQDPKVSIGDIVRISKNKNIFGKDYFPNWSGEVYMIKNVKKTAPQTYAISALEGEEIVAMFYQKELQKTNQKQFRVEKVIKRKGDK